MSGAFASRMVTQLLQRRLALDVLLLAFVAFVMAELGPFRTLDVPQPMRSFYWFVAVFGSGAMCIIAEGIIATRVRGLWWRILVTSLVVTPPVTVYVYAINALLLDLPRRWWLMHQLAWQVLVVMLLLLTLRGLLWRRVVEIRTIVMPPLPEAERNFRLRLSAKRRSAPLLALQAEDHFVRVHTDTGSELLPMRFADAVAELERAYGFQVHRSWWVAADAIEVVRWSRGGGTARLVGGILAPVSRRYANRLKSAGWR